MKKDRRSHAFIPWRTYRSELLRYWRYFRLFPLPVNARHREISLLCSEDDALSQPSERLLETSLRAITQAKSISFPSSSTRPPSRYLHIWPGEHYKLLASIVACTQPKTIVEIGTATGLSALSMVHSLPQNSRLITFDLIPWDQIPGTYLTPDDFKSGSLHQVLSDLSLEDEFKKHQSLLQEADLIFLDGPKDDHFEPLFLRLLNQIDLPKKPLLILDDIRLWNMLKPWRTLNKPKIDLTSFGHWSGTGLVDWQSN